MTTELTASLSTQLKSYAGTQALAVGGVLAREVASLQALGVSKLLSSVLFQTGSRDPVLLAGIVSLLIVVSTSACLWPARRATRLDPVNALRND